MSTWNEFTDEAIKVCVETSKNRRRTRSPSARSSAGLNKRPKHVADKDECSPVARSLEYAESPYFNSALPIPALPSNELFEEDEALVSEASRRIVEFNRVLRSLEAGPVSSGGLSRYFISELLRRIRASENDSAPAASSYAIDGLPSHEATADEKATPCVICQEDLSGTLKRMPCSHAFHQSCLEKWLHQHNSCPTCRCEIESCCPRYNTFNRSKICGVVRAEAMYNDNYLSETRPQDVMLSICNNGTALEPSVLLPSEPEARNSEQAEEEEDSEDEEDSQEEELGAQHSQSLVSVKPIMIQSRDSDFLHLHRDDEFFF
eukprot:768466-Hanusia_phi.AAC.3